MNQKQDTVKSIGVVTCYLGKLPWYFSYFAHSCAYNPTVDFFIISDDNAWNGELPGNVKLIYKTLEEINALATARMDISIDIKYGYKLCDFKPAYGIIFNELIRDYDFWGYGDIDVIFGNIREFITSEILDFYDIVSIRHDFLTGYFQLFRNTSQMLRLYEQSKDYIKVFTSDEHFCFDETNFQHEAFSADVPIEDIECSIESMMHVVKKLQRRGEIKAYFEFHVAEGVPGRLTWSKGKMVYKNKYEVILYHLIKFKKKYWQTRYKKNIPDTFHISRKNIYHKPQPTLKNNAF